MRATRPLTARFARLLCRRTGPLVLALAALGSGVSGVEGAHVADRIVAIVNNDVIMLSELKVEIAQEAQRLRSRYRGTQLEWRLQQAEYMGLTRMIERKLQMQTAKQKGVEVSDEEVRMTVAELKRQGEKVSDADPRERELIREQLVLMKVVDREVRSNVMASETEYRRYYEQHQTRFVLPAEYRISQILFVPKSGEGTEELRERAMAVQAQLKQGGDFAALVTLHSDGAEAARGGSLGFVRQGELLPPIERALADMQPGQISEIIETPLGLNIIRLEEKKPSQYRPYAEVKSEIQNLVYQQKTEDVYQQWIAGLKDKAYIDIKF
jgi:parvulin-like peptidyl-prolyl isomerase